MPGAIESVPAQSILPPDSHYHACRGENLTKSKTADIIATQYLLIIEKGVTDAKTEADSAEHSKPAKARHFEKASGIIVNGKRIKSLVFTTDLAIIRNCDADAVFAVYPFTPQQCISEAIIKAAYVPVFCGVGGGTTKGLRTIGLAKDVESQGAMGVVLNSPTSDFNLLAVAQAVDIPVIITVVNDKADIAKRIEAGASIINVAGGAKTADLVQKIRKEFPKVPIIASGGNTQDSIKCTVDAGANAITYTPPTARELFKELMSKYRNA